MTKDAYPAVFHSLHRQIRDISYPTDKEIILKIAGGRWVNVGWNESVSLATLVEKIKKERFSCAADFYCALIASMG